MHLPDKAIASGPLKRACRMYMLTLGGLETWLRTAEMTRPVPSLALPGHWAPEHQAATASFESATENISLLWAPSTTQVPRKDCTEPNRDLWIRLRRCAFFHSRQDRDLPESLQKHRTLIYLACQSGLQEPLF